MAQPEMTPHPESLRPRVFVRTSVAVYENLATGEAVEWTSVPDGGNFWQIDVNALADLNFVRREKQAVPAVDQEMLDYLTSVGLKVGDNGNIESV